MQIIEKLLSELKPYAKNPRKNDKAVGKVAASIREFGWKVPLVIDRDGTIIAGHTRFKAAQQLGMDRVPCIIADDLTPDQVKAFRLVDNKVGELADWDFDLLADELGGIFDVDMDEFGFDLDQVADSWFDTREKNDTSRQEGNEEYNEFLDKFELKKTTDDCYTPELVYAAVVDWVENEYGVSRENFVRPFYPGGDYQKEKYPEGAVVVDNPPFSILAEILNWYHDHGVKFFLFAPKLTLFSSSSSSCAIPTGVSVTYENGAVVATSFLTNLEDPALRVRTAPTLYRAVQEANDETQKALHKELPKYSYPDEVITASMVARWSKYGVDFRLPVMESALISALDAQKEFGKAIFGKGYLLSERAAAERAAAQRWALSERERAIVRSLGHGQEAMEDKD